MYYRGVQPYEQFMSHRGYLDFGTNPFSFPPSPFKLYRVHQQNRTS